MPARHEQIGERAGHEQAMSVLLEPAIPYFDLTKPNTRLMIPIGCSTLARTFDLVRFFPRSAWSTTPRWAIAAVDKVPRSGRMPADHCPLAAIRLVAPHAGFAPVQRIGQHGAVGDIGRCRHHGVDQLAATVDP